MINPLVSIIIPAWNTAAYLPETLQSVLAQSYQNFEVIMVDDGSTDGTFDIMQAWAERDQRFTAICQPANQGVVAARNAALAVATGDYVAMLDGDDIWLPDALSIRINVARDFPDAAVLATDFAWFEESIVPEAKGRVAMGAKARALFDEAYRTGHPAYLQDAFDAVSKLHFAWTGATLVRRDRMTEVGNFDPDFDGPEDTLLWLALANAGAFVFVPVITAYYRQRAGSLVHNQREPKEFHYLKLLDYLLQKTAYDRHRKAILELAGSCCEVCVVYFRRQKQWHSAGKFALRAVRLDPFKAVRWRSLAAVLLLR